MSVKIGWLCLLVLILNLLDLSSCDTNDDKGTNGFEKISPLYKHRLQRMVQTRKKRFVMISSTQPNKAHQKCVAPGGRQGHCRHVHYCVLPDFKTNFLKFMDYMCIIERSFIGVCCPDETIERASANIGLAGDLPAGGVEADDAVSSNGDEEQPASAQNRGCGVGGGKSGPRITGGRPADPGEWPWMAALIRPPPGRSFCGGVLITNQHVLTAAHCTHRFKPKDIIVRLGEYDFTRSNDTRSRDFRVLEINPHEGFQASTYEHDICIIKIHRPATFNSYIWPICLPPIDETWENKPAVVTGWGTMFFGGPHSDVLMEVQVPVWEQNRCTSAFTQRIPSTVLCAGGFEGGRDSCQGDSGGPLLHMLPNGRWVTIGVVSWGLRCGEPKHPGVYTRVNTYLRWIVEHATF